MKMMVDKVLVLLIFCNIHLAHAADEKVSKTFPINQVNYR